jgi:hypothetical protein
MEFPYLVVFTIREDETMLHLYNQALLYANLTGRRGLLQVRLSKVSVELYISARLVVCCRERL